MRRSTLDAEALLRRSLAHDRLSSQFDELMNDYDVRRRMHVLMHEFLGDIRGKTAIDGGCGVGAFTGALIKGGARVLALDVGPNLAALTRARYGCPVAIGTLTQLAIASNSFDIVLSSEAIEHTPNPRGAVLELFRVVKPGGHLVLSTPNRLWQAPVRFATAIGLRPYDGFENFVWPSELRRTLELAGGRVLDHRGLHLWPFHIRALHRASEYLDRFGRGLLPLMINQCIHCTKPI
jgi:2-polyprenyl-3-methyl-5-hydroxy-6-metoxy-1,4-benzoquinol methylase